MKRAKSIPIVLVHTGDNFYLKYALASARKSNPASKIYLLCEGTSEDFEGVEKLPVSSYNKLSKELEKIYVHKSCSVPKIELFCIQRWLVLREFMQKEKIGSVFAMDSDVILFENISKDFFNYSKYDFTLCNGSSAGTAFIRTKKVLEKYSEIVMDFYKNKVGKIEYEANGTITDMSFWKVLKKSGLFRVGEMTDIIDKAVYDSGILTKQNEIEMHKGMKKIIFNSGVAYCKTPAGLLRMKCIHCQAQTKFYMKYYLAGRLGRLSILKVNIIMWLKNNVGQMMHPNAKGFAKKIIAKLGF